MKFCLVVLVSVWVCAAQEYRLLRGEIQSGVTEDLSWLAVRLDPSGSQVHGETSPVGFGGDFGFSNVPQGLYTLRVMDSNGNEILSQFLTVSSSTPTISIRLPRVVAERPTGETTSVARLRHTPDRQALQAARKAQKFSESGDYQSAAMEWEKAVKADPKFSEAHGNLGAQYVKLNRSIEAVQEFQRAIALDPATARYQSNLAVALAHLGRLEEAESWARHAVQQDGSNALGHYVLGCVLTSRIATVPEAIQQLQIAARQIPRAHQVLSGIYRVQGKPALAIAEMQQYQETIEAQAGPKTESWSSTLH